MSAQAEARPVARGAVNIMATGPVGQVAELAAHAEHLGFGRIWIADEGMSTRDVFVSLTAVAARTTRALIGPGITNPFVRHPAVTAGAVATLHEFSNGRAFCGLGAGGGLSLGPLAVQRRRPVQAVADMIGAMRALWAGETVTMQSHAFSLQNARLHNAPPDAHIKIHVAGRGPKMVQTAGRLADGFYISYVHKAFIGELVQRLGSAGRRLWLTCCTRIVTTEADWEAARRDMSIRIPDSPPEIHNALGITPTEVAAVRSALAAGGPALAAREVRAEWVEPFVISGTTDECRTELAALMSTFGMDEFTVNAGDLNTAPELLESMADILGLRPPSG